MKVLFADSYFWFALINPHDIGHSKARAFGKKPAILLTTAWVLTELADGLCKATHRSAFLRLLDLIRIDPFHEVLPADQELLERGLDLFAARPDKDWSLTDCISFVVMHEREVQEALTADHHFEQAGFIALLK